MSSQPILPVSQSSADALPWFGVRTKSNQEKICATVLAAKGFEQYLPTYRTQRRWSDRTVERELPLFPGYVFCRFHPADKLKVISTPGVASVITFGSIPAPIDNREIEAIQVLIQSGKPVVPHSYLREGQAVRVTSGPLEGVEGILVKKRTDWRIVVSVTLLQRSVAVEVDRDCLAAL